MSALCDYGSGHEVGGEQDVEYPTERNIMATDSSTLNSQHELLLKENEQLKKSINDLHQEQQSIEALIVDANNKQLQAEINAMELEEIFSSVSDPMWSLRDDGIIIRANEAMLKLLNRPLEEVVGQLCSDLLDYSLCHTASCPLGVGRTLVRQEYDIQMQTNDPQHSNYYIISAAPLTTIVGTRAVVVQFKDITARKEAENQLAKLNQTLTEMARIDGLTGIANRRFFDEFLDKEWRRLLRGRNQNFSLILADIDYFKNYNDNYGHQAGDDTLIKVAQAIKGAIMRPPDLVARYGGEEFAIVLPEVDISGAKTVGDRILEVITDLKLEHHYSDIADHVTLSMGAACLIPSAATSPEQIIAMADKALYRAKSTGRNNLTLAQ